MRKGGLIPAAAVFLALAPSGWGANLPLKIPFSGRLVDPATQEPRNGLFAMTFRLYAAPEGGAPLFTETQPAVRVANGAFAVHIGSMAALSPSLFAGASAYLSLQVASDAEMSPRWPMLMMPYAMTAAQLSGDAGVRVRAGAVSSTFTAGGDLLVPAGVSASSAAFGAAVPQEFTVSAASGVLSQAGTVRSLGSGGVVADFGLRAATVTAAAFFESGAPAETPVQSPSGRVRVYYDTARDSWLASANGRAYSPLGRISTTLWNSDATGSVANQGLNLPAALTELDVALEGTRTVIDCGELPARLALGYTFRSLQVTSLTITLSVRDVSNTANILASASQSVNAVQTWTGEGSYTDKPAWCTGVKTVAVYTEGGNGSRDYIFRWVGLRGRP